MVSIQEIITQTIQGEGRWAGMPADFIRLWGCPVGCHFCDTGYAKGSTLPLAYDYEIPQVLDLLCSQNVVISGGEPLFCKELPELITALFEQNRSVYVETSGAHWREDMPSGVWVTLSPKEHLNPKYPVVPGAWVHASELKIVISTGDEWDYYQPRIPQIFRGKIFLQPEWENRAETIPFTLELLKLIPEARLSLQTHKMIGLRK